jgi:hypothetical protein
VEFIDEAREEVYNVGNSVNEYKDKLYRAGIRGTMGKSVNSKFMGKK